jgi:hypothetical protein
MCFSASPFSASKKFNIFFTPKISRLVGALYLGALGTRKGVIGFLDITEPGPADAGLACSVAWFVPGARRCSSAHANSAPQPGSGGTRKPSVSDGPCWRERVRRSVAESSDAESRWNVGNQSRARVNLDVCMRPTNQTGVHACSLAVDSLIRWCGTGRGQPAIQSRPCGAPIRISWCCGPFHKW